MIDKLIIRISKGSISFTTVDSTNMEQPVMFQPYNVKAGISIAANLREAFRTEPLLTGSYQRVMCIVDSPVLMVPVDLYQEGDRVTLYSHSYPSRKQNTVLANVLPDLNCVAIYDINSDLKTVVNDHFPQAQYVCCMASVWRHLHQRSFTGVRAKLYGYFHDQRLEVFSFQQNLQQEHDELHLVGDIPEKEELLDEMRKYLKRTYVINPVADFNRSPVTGIDGMPYDLMTLIVKGR